MCCEEHVYPKENGERHAQKTHQLNKLTFLKKRPESQSNLYKVVRSVEEHVTWLVIALSLLYLMIRFIVIHRRRGVLGEIWSAVATQQRVTECAHARLSLVRA